MASQKKSILNKISPPDSSVNPSTPQNKKRKNSGSQSTSSDDELSEIKSASISCKMLRQCTMFEIRTVITSAVSTPGLTSLSIEHKMEVMTTDVIEQTAFIKCKQLADDRKEKKKKNTKTAKPKVLKISLPSSIHNGKVDDLISKQDSVDPVISNDNMYFTSSSTMDDERKVICTGRNNSWKADTVKEEIVPATCSYSPAENLYSK